MSPRIVLLIIAALIPVAASAQNAGTGGAGRLGPRALLPRAREIALARSAAPTDVSDSATVYVFTAQGYEVAVRGTNGVECYVSRSWPKSLEPHCFDAEGARTILPMDRREIELMHRGVPRDSIDRDISTGIVNGTYALPTRPAMSWMMSSAQELINDDGTPVGAWRPHLMIYYPYLTATQLGLTGAMDLRHAVLVDGGRATSNIMIVVGSAIDPVPAGAPPSR